MKEDLEFFKNSHEKFNRSEEKINLLKNNIKNITKYKENLKEKFLAEIKAKKTKSSEDRAFEILLTSTVDVDVQLVRDWFREIIINLLKSKNIMEKLNNGSMKYKDLFLIFLTIMNIESHSIFKRPSTLNDEFHDPYFYREASNDISRRDLNQKVLNWVSSLI